MGSAQQNVTQWLMRNREQPRRLVYLLSSSDSSSEPLITSGLKSLRAALVQSNRVLSLLAHDFSAFASIDFITC